MKTAVSIPDPLFRRADKLAKKLKLSRSGLYAQAIAEFVARHDDEEVRASYEALCKEVDTKPDPGLQEAIRRVYARVGW